LIANGVDPSALTTEDAEEVASMLAQTGRAIPAGKWVDEFADHAIQAESERALAMILG